MASVRTPPVRLPGAPWAASSGRRLWRPGPTILVLLAVLSALAAPSAARADNGPVRLALRPVGQPGSFFDLLMAPGETRRLEVDIANNGNAPIDARTYAADVYTIINGGFGARLRDELRTGTTDWVDYTTLVLHLEPGNRTRRTFVVAVPANSGPGEYITSLILENDQPVSQDGAVALNQVVRQAVAVVVTVPGQRLPHLGIGSGAHKVVGGVSVVTVAVENSGNVRLKPRAEFALFDAAGALVSRATVAMDTFYAHTRTSVEMPLAALLPDGTYTLRMKLVDSRLGATADAAIQLIVASPASSAGAAGAVPGPFGVVQSRPGGGVLLTPLVVLLAVAILLGVAHGVVNRRERLGRGREGSGAG